jgi:NAD(P)-dependent dehydrogenase (short-subunit alcohol dehydrogenase family)
VYPSATVYAAVRDIPKAVELQQVVNLSKGRVQLLRIESGDPSSFKLAAAEIATKTQSLDFVIYNSGVLRGWGNVLEVGIEPLKENIETNVYGAYHAAVEFSPFLLKSGFQNKSLVFVSSTFASLSLPIFEEHQAFGMPGCDPTAMYNISKVSPRRVRHCKAYFIYC